MTNNSKHSAFEIIGVLSLLLGLLLVAYELRQNSMAAQAQTRVALTQIAHDMIRAESDPGMAEINEALRQGEPLTADQRRIEALNLALHFRSAENIFFQHRIGTLDDDEFSGYLNFYRRQFSQPHVIVTWEAQKEIFSREFQREIAVLISEL